MMVIPGSYVEIELPKHFGRLLRLKPMRISTREKFRRRRRARKIRKMLNDNFLGQPINSETREAVRLSIIKNFGHLKY